MALVEPRTASQQSREPVVEARVRQTRQLHRAVWLPRQEDGRTEHRLQAAGRAHRRRGGRLCAP